MKIKTCVVELEDVVMWGYHGVGEMEGVVGNEFKIKVRLHGNFEDAVRTDDLDHAADYGAVYEIVRREMGVRSKLLEHVAGRIADAILKETDRVDEVEVVLQKRRPPMGGEVGYSGVRIVAARD